MSRIAFIENIADRRAARKKERGRKKALRKREHQQRIAKVVKALACVALLAAFAGLGFLVGSEDYRATLIGWVPFGMTLAGIILAAVYLLALRAGIVFEEQLIAPECERNSQTDFSVVIRNKTPLLATRITATFFIADMFDNVANEVSTTLSLAPFETYQMPFGTRFEHIGSYHAGLERLVVSDFIGLFTYSIENVTKQVVQVTPKVLDLADVQFSEDADEDSESSARSVLADSMDYAYVREYELGDPLKTIHWKLSARSGTYMTRLYEIHSNPTVAIVMDWYADVHEAEQLMGMYDAIVESALSIARFARRQGMEVQLLYVNRYGEIQSREDIYQDKLSEIVGDLPPMTNVPFHAVGTLNILEELAAGTRSFNNVFVCTGNMSAEMVSAVLQVKMRQRSPVVVAVVPSSLVGREREDYCANLGRLDSDEVPYRIIAGSEELLTGGAANG